MHIYPQKYLNYFMAHRWNWNSKYVFRDVHIHKDIETRMKLILLSTEHFKCKRAVKCGK